jgi:hypothetical protein
MHLIWCYQNASLVTSEKVNRHGLRFHRTRSFILAKAGGFLAHAFETTIAVVKDS